MRCSHGIRHACRLAVRDDSTDGGQGNRAREPVCAGRVTPERSTAIVGRCCYHGGSTMLARYILAVLGTAFLIAGGIRGPRSPQGRTWLLIAAIFGAVSVWLFATA